MQRREGLVPALAAVLSGLMASFVIHAPAGVPGNYSDIVSFWSRPWVSGGQLPYVTEPFEYPPVSGLLLYVARMVGGDLTGYYNVFSLMSFAAGALLAWSCWSISRRQGKGLKAFYFILPSVVFCGIFNFDLFHAAFMMLSIQGFVYGRRSMSAASLGLAVSTKLVSAVLLPVFLISLLDPGLRSWTVGRSPRTWWPALKGAFADARRWHWRPALLFSGVFAAVVAAFNVPFMVANFQSWYGTFTYVGGWGLEDVWYVWVFQNPATWGYAKVFGFVLMAVLLARVYTLKTDVVMKCFLAVGAYLMGTYIYAPQYNLLVIPLLAVLAADSPSLYLWDTFNVLIILTWFIGYQSPTWAPTLAWTLPQEFALLRTVAFVWMAAELLKREGWTAGALLPWLRQKTG